MQTVAIPTTYDFLSGGGEMGKLIRSIDWSKTAAGPVDQWPQSLRTAISIMLNAQFPMYIAWSDAFIQFYNDGYRPILGSTKHPAAMGTSTKVTFAEIWHIIGPMFEGVMQGKAVGFTDFLLPLDRHGFTEECYFIFSYSPIKQENGLTGGVLVTVTETTERLLGERRLRTLRELGDRAAKAKNIGDAFTCVHEAISNNRHDVPFSLLYRYDSQRDTYQLADATGIRLEGTPLPDVDKLHKLAAVGALEELRLDDVFDSIQFRDDLPWPELPERCCVILLARPDQKYPFGLLLLGISPRLRYDQHYSNFFKLLMDQAVTALSSANAFEEERKRAEALAEIDRAKTAFFSNISHEFRTPLTLMLGPLEELLQNRNALEPRHFENADTAHRNAMRLLRLVNSLLDFSRIESGRIDATFRPVDLARITADLASNFRSVVEKAGLQLHIRCEPITEKVYVDQGMWEKIILNLLSNAFKFTLQGSVTVTLVQQGRNAVLKVIDTGVGIPDNELPKMFERFHRIENSGGRSYEGSGIGLSLVSELVSLHHGHISVESRLNEGSTFTVSIPLGQSHLPAEKIVENEDVLRDSLLSESYAREAAILSGQALARSGLPVGSNGNGQKSASVLIVDDNGDMLSYLQRILEPFYTVRTALNGRAALKELDIAVPDLIVSDIMMPVMDGVELLRRVKADARTASIPVMLLSARAGEESRIEGYDLGADDYLVKPFSAKELLARVKAQIQIARTRSHLSTLLKHVFEQTPAAITIIRKENYIVEFANDLYLEIVDRGRDFIGRSLFDSLPELRNQGIRELLDNVMRTGIPHRGEELMIDINRQGRREKACFNFIYHPLREQDGAITGVIVVCFEVTELALARKRAEESEILLEAKVAERTAELETKNDELRQQKEFIETIIDSSVDVIGVFDAEMRFLMVNRKFEELYGVQRPQVLGRGVEEIFPRVKGSLFYDFVRDAMRGNARHTKEYRSLVTGSIYELYTVPLTHSNEVYAVLAIAHDNTEVMTAAQTLAEKNDQLLKINEELEQFAYIASHDLQEPLRKIRIFSSLLENHLPVDPLSARYFEKIHSSSERMSRLIKDLLNYSRLSNTEVRLEEVHLSDILESVVSDFELLIDEKHARVSWPRLPVIQGIPLQLHQLFSNLVSNALKFSNGEPVIDIRYRVVQAEDAARYHQPLYHPAYHEIAVRDNGIGFDQKYSDQVFTIFQRLHDKDTPGTGIGLALCRKIAENHRGFIRVESTPGAGAEFFIYLPSSGQHIVNDDDHGNG